MTTAWWCASSLCVLLACGDPATRVPDPGLPGIDGGVVSDPVDPATAVTVTVTLDGVARPGVVVYFQSSYLGPSTELRTDATGSAIAVVDVPLYDANSVTLVNPFGPLDATTDELLTYSGVKPGDHLQVARDRRTPPVVHVSLAAPIDPGAASYRLHTTCGAADLAIDMDRAQVGGPVALTGCGAKVDMLVESLDTAAHSLGSLYAGDVPASEGGSVTLTGDYRPSHAKTLTFDTLDVKGPQLEVHARLLTPKGVLYDSPTWTVALSFMDDHPSLTVMLPSLPGAIAVTESVYESGEFGLEHTVDWGPDAPRYELDLQPSGSYLEQYQTMPELTWAITYAETGGAVQWQYMRARVTVERPGDRTWQWSFVGPQRFGGGTEPWPQIPADVYPYNRQDGDVWTVSEATLVYAPGGYDAIRARVLSIDSPVAQLAGPSGRLVFEGIRPQ